MRRLSFADYIINKSQALENVRRRRVYCGAAAGICGMAVNLLFALCKSVLGILLHSVSMVADGVNNITDACSGAITLIGFSLSDKKPDGEHPYGHGRAEYVSGLLIAFFVLALGLSLVRSSVLRILSPKDSGLSVLAAVILILSVFAKLWLSLFYKRLYKETGSATLSAAAADSRNDVVTTCAVLLSGAVYAIFGVDADGWAGLAVSVFVLISGIRLVRDTIDPLLGSPPDSGLVEQIYSIALSHNGVYGVHDLAVHNYGPGRLFATLHVEMSEKTGLTESHELADAIERQMRQDLGLDMVIHVDPTVTDDNRVVLLKMEILSLLTDIDCRFTLHDFRAVFSNERIKLIFDVVVPDDIGLDDITLRDIINERFCAEKRGCELVITFDRSYSKKRGAEKNK